MKQTMKRIMNYPHLMKIVILASGIMIAGSILMLTAELSRYHRLETCAYLRVPDRSVKDESDNRVKVPGWEVQDYRLRAYVHHDLYEEFADYCGLELGER